MVISMKLSDILKDIDIIEASANLEIEISDICSDSRKASKGALFVAVTGFETDGHKYIPAAVDLGASCVICEHKPETDIPFVVVDNSRKALAYASANFYGRPADKMTMIGITGTNGKTTSTYLLKTILESGGAKVGLIGTNQNMIGDRVLDTERTTPESNELQLLFKQMHDEGCTHVVMEVSSHALELNRVDGVRFNVGVFTNLTQDHLDFHDTMDKYCMAKSKLFTMCDVGVLNLDDEACEKIIGTATCDVFTYSTKSDEADLVAKNIRLKNDSVSFEALLPGNIRRIELGIPGEFTDYNALGVIGAALQLGFELKQIEQALKSASGVKGRVEVVPTGTDYTMIIDYAHTPDALENVLSAVRGFAKGRVVVLFGCGGDRDGKKRPLMGAIAAKMADFVIVTSDNPRTEEPMSIINDILTGMEGTKTPYTVIEDRRKAIRWSMDNAQPEDVIVLAGKGHETYQIIGKTKTHLDEREEIAAHLQEIKE